MSIEIRSARASDALAITALVRSERLNPTGLDWRNFQVAEDAGEIVGAAQIRPNGPELGSLVVRADRRGLGLAARLIAAALRPAASPVYVVCPAGLATFYQRYGFRRTRALAAPRRVRLNYVLGQAAVVLALRGGRRPRRLVVMARAPAAA